MNPWLFSFIISFVLLLLIADWRRILQNIYGGILSALFMFADSVLGKRLGLFHFHYVSLGLPEWIVFSDTVNIFFTGIAFNIGIILVQLLPKRLGYQCIHALIWTLFLLVFHFLISQFELITYLKFRPYFVVRQFLLFLFLAWIKNNFVQKVNADRQIRW